MYLKIQTTDELLCFIKEIKKTPITWVAIDTEFQRETTFFPILSLIQIATESKIWLIDALSCTDLTPLKILLEKFDPSCQVIYTSSTGIYPNENRQYDESSVIETSSLLGDLEQKIKERSHYCILRLAGLIGPNRHPVKFLLKQETRENGAAVVNLIHQKDVIQAIVSCISQEKNQAIYNVCYPEHPTRAAYYNEAAKFYFQQEMTFNSGEKGKIILANKLEKERKFKKD